MKSTIKVAFVSSLLTLGIGSAVYAQKKAAPKKPAATTQSHGFTKLASGLEYKIVKHGTGKRKPVINDHIEMFIHVHVKDSVLFDSRKMYGVKPVPYTISAPKFKGDPVEGFMLMVAGDSAIFMLPVDSMQKGGNQLLPWMKSGDKIEYDVTLKSVKSDAEEKKENEAKAAVQKVKDEKILQDYFKKNNIKPMKTASGLYYTIAQEGTGAQITAGESVSVNYRGKTLDGKTFDTNMDSSFHHMEPLTLEIGKGRVIKGWDEGIPLLKKGSKATLYIPSGLAYGSQDRSTNGIPANSILVFDVDVVDVKTAEEAKKENEEKMAKQKKENEEKMAVQKLNEDRDLKDYFAKNNIKATKTESGLYYSITKEGTGNNAKVGQKVTMGYIGKLMNGKVFDKNMDSNYVSTGAPFTFVLGQHRVIEGWDQGVQLLNKGTRATLYIPSYLAYGARGTGGIPPNSILIFDVEVVNIEE